MTDLEDFKSPPNPEPPPPPPPPPDPEPKTEKKPTKKTSAA